MAQNKSGQSVARGGNTPVTADEMLALFGEIFDRETVAGLLEEVEKPQSTYAWRILTPLVVLWGFVYQRLKGETLDGFVGHLHSGAADVSRTSSNVRCLAT